MPQRTALSGPTLVRLLARLADVQAAPPELPLADQLSRWLGWTDAIALSTALQGQSGATAAASGWKPDAALAGAGTPSDAAAPSPYQVERDRVRAALAAAIAQETVGGPRRIPPRGRPASAAIDASVDYAVYQQRYQHLQQTMEGAIGPLRARLRTALAARPHTAGLAALDAVMERVLEPREQALLGGVAAMLAPHFERLRASEEAALAGAALQSEAPGVKPGAWLRSFRRDMQTVLLAELDIRFQPVDGLLAALLGN